MWVLGGLNKLKSWLLALKEDLTGGPVALTKIGLWEHESWGETFVLVCRPLGKKGMNWHRSSASPGCVSPLLPIFLPI